MSRYTSHSKMPKAQGGQNGRHDDAVLGTRPANTAGVGTSDHLDCLRAEIEWRQSNLKRLPDNALLRQCAEQQLKRVPEVRSSGDRGRVVAGAFSLGAKSNIGDHLPKLTNRPGDRCLELPANRRRYSQFLTADVRIWRDRQEMTARLTPSRMDTSMPSTVAAVATAVHVPTVSKPPPEVTAKPTRAPSDKAAAQPTAAPSAGSSTQQQAALTRMLVTYARDQLHGADPRILSALGKQILAAAKTLGQNVTLPRAPASSGAAPATPAAASAAEKGKVNVTA